MNKNIYLAITIDESGMFYSWAYKISACYNLLSVFAGIANLKSANVCDTWKQAKETVAAWNETYKQNGTYLFSNPAF